MYKNIYFSLLIALSLMTCQPSQPSLEKLSFASFADSLFQTSVDSSFIAGASVFVFQNGEELLNKSYGFASLELSVPMPEVPSFEIGSVTKQFTAAAILKLVEQGKLSLEDDFTKYLDFDSRGRKITIHHLLNHTSGIDSYTEIPDFWDLSLHKFDRDSLVRLVEQRDFLFAPGEALIYNNSAYFFLGLIIEKVSKMDYKDYLEEQFFGPLGMHNTYYASSSEVVPNKVIGYDYSRNGLRQKPYIDHTWPYAAGSLGSTTADLFIWMEALHQGKVLKEALYKKLIRPQTLKDGSKLRYALGLVNYSNFGHQEISHGGAIHGFLSQTSYFPESDLYIVCLVNTTGPKGADFFADQLTWKILSKKVPKKKEMEMDKSKVLGNYSGPVRGGRLSIRVDEIADGLTLLPQGQDQADTLRHYIGHRTWMDGNDLISFSDEALIIDKVYGHYVLKRIDKPVGKR